MNLMWSATDSWSQWPPHWRPDLLWCPFVRQQLGHHQYLSSVAAVGPLAPLSPPAPDLSMAACETPSAVDVGEMPWWPAFAMWW